MDLYNEQTAYGPTRFDIIKRNLGMKSNIKRRRRSDSVNILLNNNIQLMYSVTIFLVMYLFVVVCVKLFENQIL